MHFGRDDRKKKAKMLKKIVLDLETQREFAEVGGRGKNHLLKVSVAGIYDYNHDRYQVFREHELARLSPILQTADQIIGYNIKDKFTKFYKKTRTFDIKCLKCGYKDKYVDVKKGLPKANCDVELTVDCLEIAGPKVEFLIFTGDGDFKYLVEKLIEKGSKVSLFSTKKQDKWGDYRFSTRYDDMLKGGIITFMEINNLKYRLKKDVENEAPVEEIDSL